MANDSEVPLTPNDLTESVDSSGQQVPNAEGVDEYRFASQLGNEGSKIIISVAKTMRVATPSVTLIVIFIAVAFIGITFYAFIIHMFFPGLGWLDATQQSRLTSMYSSIAAAGLPVYIIATKLLPNLVVPNKLRSR